MKYEIKQNPPDYDSDDVTWPGTPGFGYIAKRDSRKRIHIVRCPKCGNENYMHQTICITCGFDPNGEID